MRRSQYKVFIVSLILGLYQIQCASDNEVKEIDTSLEVKGKTSEGEIGINDDGEAIIQEKTAADDELRRQQWVNNRLEESLATEHYELKRCRDDLADPRLGGDGSVREIPEIDKMKSPENIKEEFGTDEKGELKVVRRQDFKEKLKAEQKYEKTLRDMVKLVASHRAECGRKMGYARVKAGLPAARYEAKGYFQTDGTWVEERKAENTLDDAFEISRRERASAKPKAAAVDSDE